MSENRFLGSITASSLRNLLPKSASSKHKTMNSRFKLNPNSENTAPIDPNIQIDNKIPLSLKSIKQSLKSIKQASEILPANSDKMVIQQELASPSSDPPVKVVVRIKPSNTQESEGDVAKKVSADTVAVGDRRFTFDSVLDSKSNQEDVFQIVGVPSVKNALAGYNTSILAYGQSGSGKTYTMWGLHSGVVGSQAANGDQGIVSRIFQMLFSEIKREQDNSEGKQINYQCRCSFLEIYNEQIGDLLDPTRRNLEIKDDAKHGYYVENLTEEYVTSYEDISKILMKGLSSRKVGSTTINSKSSRSHIVFTCIIDSWCKEMSSKCFGGSKTSKISLIDLAGLERNKLDDIEKQCVMEEKIVKKSLSQLGHLVNILSEGTPPRKTEDSSYRKSKLTYLLKESLGGNAKLTVVCCISPDDNVETLSTLRFGQRVKSIQNDPVKNPYLLKESLGGNAKLTVVCCISPDDNVETLSTLRFGQRVKSIQNDPVKNELSEDDVSDQIRQLKEELIKAKSNGCHSVGSKSGYSDVKSVRGSLNLLRLSLNRSLILPSIENESNKEVNSNEEDVQQLQVQLENLKSFGEDDKREANEDESDTDWASEQYESCMDDGEMDVINLDNQLEESSEMRERNMSISLSHTSALQDPASSESPKIANRNRKNVTFASSHIDSHDIVSECSNEELKSIRESRRSDLIRSSLMLSKVLPGPTGSLAASLHRGLEIIDTHQRNSDSNRASVAFSFEHLADKANASNRSSLCSSCRQLKEFSGPTEVEGAGNEVSVVQLPKDTRERLAEAINREKELQKICQEQATRIEQLNTMEKELQKICQEQATRIEQLNTMKNGLDGPNEQNPIEEQRKLLRWDDDGEHDEQISFKEKCEIKEVMEEIDMGYQKKPFDANEKEALLNEIETLKNKLKSITNRPSTISHDELRSSLLSKSIQLRKSGVFSQYNSEEELEKEREKWMEMESDWISLTDGLRIDLESNRQRAEKVEAELRLEKKSTVELEDALHRSVLVHARMVEHYADLQEKYDGLFEKHRLTMQGIAEIKKAASKAGAKGRGSRFEKAMAAELSELRVERAREMELLKKENKSLKVQLRDTAEAVHAAGEVLVRLREAEEAASFAEEKAKKLHEENEKLRKQVEKQKRKHKIEMVTMKQYLAESKLPESALRPLYRNDSSNMSTHNMDDEIVDDDEAWRAEFGAIYQDHY